MAENQTYVGTKDTGIFCIEGCEVGEAENGPQEAFSHAATALLHGYSPCKKCGPVLGSSPEYIKRLRTIDNEHLHDWQLREIDLDPAVIRRWFQSNYNFTFHTYQRLIRMNKEFHEIEAVSPDNLIDKIPIYLQRFSTPLGQMYAAATDEGLCLLEFVERRMLEREFGDLKRYLKGDFVKADNGHIRQAQEELRTYFSGEGSGFSVALHTPGTDFQQKVWKALATLAPGTTLSYGELAERLGNSRSVRATANAVGHNRIAIIIPCHRVIGKDGSLTGYAGGLHRKRWLLDHEAGKNPAAP